MPDITKCTNQTCKMRNECFRFICKPKVYEQSYTYITPIDGICNFKIPIKTINNLLAIPR